MTVGNSAFTSALSFQRCMVALVDLLFAHTSANNITRLSLECEPKTYAPFGRALTPIMSTNPFENSRVTFFLLHHAH